MIVAKDLICSLGLDGKEAQQVGLLLERVQMEQVAIVIT